MAKRKIPLSDLEIAKRLKHSIEEMKKIGNFNVEIIKSYEMQLENIEKEIEESNKKRLILT